MKIGTKIWSINIDAFKTLKGFYKKGYIDYVELYVVPNSFDKDNLKHLKGIPLIFHAPTEMHFFNIVTKGKNFRGGLSTLNLFSKYFKRKKVIFHPGTYGSMKARKARDAGIRTLKKLKTHFDIIIENVPRRGIDSSSLIGGLPVEMKQILRETKAKFCLDFAHAVCAANSSRKDSFEFIKELVEFKPFMFHISDGKMTQKIDGHRGIGDGNFPLKKMLAMIPRKSYVTLETPKNDYQSLKEDLENLNKIKAIFAKI